jgi:hypothetical protein
MIAVTVLGIIFQCLSIASLHPVDNSCMVVDDDKFAKIYSVKCSDILKSCNSEYIKKLPIMCSGKTCKG